MLIATAGLKISWHDYTSLGYGIVLGITSGMALLWARGALPLLGQRLKL